MSFFAPFFQSSTFLSLRFVRVVASEFFFRLRVVHCDDSARFFMGNPIGFASRNFFLKVPSVLPLFFRSSSAKIFGSELRDKFSGANFGILACQYSVGHDCLPVRCWPFCLPVQCRWLCFLGGGVGVFLCLVVSLPPSRSASFLFLGAGPGFFLGASPSPT